MSTPSRKLRQCNIIIAVKIVWILVGIDVRKFYVGININQSFHSLQIFFFCCINIPYFEAYKLILTIAIKYFRHLCLLFFMNETCAWENSYCSVTFQLWILIFSKKGMLSILPLVRNSRMQNYPRILTNRSPFNNGGKPRPETWSAIEWYKQTTTTDGIGQLL